MTNEYQVVWSMGQCLPGGLSDSKAALQSRSGLRRNKSEARRSAGANLPRHETGATLGINKWKLQIIEFGP